METVLITDVGFVLVENNSDKPMVVKGYILPPGEAFKFSDGELLAKSFKNSQYPELIRPGIWPWPKDPHMTTVESFATAVLKSFDAAVLKCECGAEKCRTTHSTWCPKYNKG